MLNNHTLGLPARMRCLYGAFALLFGSCHSLRVAGARTDNEQVLIQEVVDAAVQPLLHAYKVPGLAVAVTLNGKHYFFNYGVASTRTQRPVTRHTLFELGSISKSGCCRTR